MRKDLYNKNRSYYKIATCINSCKTYEQLQSCLWMIRNYGNLFRDRFCISVNQDISELCRSIDAKRRNITNEQILKECV
jgi:hypothetical protein